MQTKQTIVLKRPSLLFVFSSSCVCSLPHGAETSFSRLLRHILSATSSLDLCVFAFSNTDLSRAVLALHSRGVTVRVLSDKDYVTITGSQIGLLRRAGKGNICLFLNHCHDCISMLCDVTHRSTFSSYRYHWSGECHSSFFELLKYGKDDWVMAHLKVLTLCS